MAPWKILSLHFIISLSFPSFFPFFSHPGVGGLPEKEKDYHLCLRPPWKTRPGKFRRVTRFTTTITPHSLGLTFSLSSPPSSAVHRRSSWSLELIMSSSTASTDGKSASSSFLFEAPRIEAELSGLLRSISEHGGYAYASVVTLAAAGDMGAAETACDMAWEQLHSGPWHSVLPIWRDAYSMACLYVAMFRFSSSEFAEALRVLDMGIIMGGTLLKKDLHSAIEKVLVKANAARVLTSVRNEGESISISQSPLLCGNLDRLEVHRNLPMKALSNKIVAKISALSLEGFLRDYFLPGFPVIISDAMDHWPARKKWHGIDYLKGVAGDRTVPVEVGKNYLCPEWKQELITFSQFLERIQSNTSCDGVTYLAQHPLFDQINELRKDICIPDYCFVGGGELRSLNAWFGPAGTVTPLHHDPHHNILAQIVGQKYVRLYAATLCEELHPYSETMLCNSSQVDLDNINENKFPKVKDLEFVDCILEEGEMLYIPPKWWHYVRSLSTSFSVSFWWNNSEDSVPS